MVYGIKRRPSSFNSSHINHLDQDHHHTNSKGPSPHLALYYGDLTESTSLIRIIQKVQPDEN